jgi:hypothetical protein
MPDPRKYDLSYRPESYWDYENNYLSSVKGWFRRLRIGQLIAEGKGDLLPVKYFASSLPDGFIEQAKNFSNRLVSGEHLPDYEPSEIEIARITYNTVFMYVISIRARKIGQRISYRVVDESNTSFTFAPKTSSRPFTFSELIEFIDGIDAKESSYFCSMVKGFHYTNLIYPDGTVTLEPFYELESACYPQLNDWFSERINEKFIAESKMVNSFVS